MVFRLYDVFETYYLTDDYADRLDTVLGMLVRGEPPFPKQIYFGGVNKYLETADMTLDLANCRITSSVERVLSKYKDSIKFVDTEDPERNKFLRGMREPVVAKSSMVKFETKPTSIEGLYLWIRNLSEEVVYDAYCFEKNPEIIVTISLVNPRVKLACNYRSLFQYIKKVFHKVLVEEAETFLYIPGHYDSFWETTRNDDGTVHVVNIGDIPVEEFVAYYPCIPKEIGTEVYMPDMFSRAWGEAVRTVMNDVSAFIDKNPMTIENVFTGVKRYDD